MTLKELVMNIDFDVLLPYLRKFEFKHLDCIYCWREAYDRLRYMQPDPDFKEVAYVKWYNDDPEEDWIVVQHLDDNVWEKELAKEIIIAENVNLSMEEIAMQCLWWITFYGFSAEEIDRCFLPEKIINKYEIARQKLEKSIYRHQPRMGYCRIGEKMNRSKRKRRYRQEQREEYLIRMSQREEFIKKVTSESSSLTRNEVEFLLDVDEGIGYEYDSVCHGKGKRLDYIFDSMTKYQQVDFSRYNQAIVCTFESIKYPLDETELDNFKTSVRLHLGYGHILYGRVVQETEEKEVKVIMLLNKCTN